ncbi:MAG TPA: hypothetical protein PLU66_04290 [Trueperaceae bacterium]|nr:hypothetical protein [Trueperaceae bacterium]
MRKIGVAKQVTAILIMCVLASAAAEQIPLVDQDGHYIAYIDTARDDTIYLWSGEPTAYLYESGRGVLIYSFSGQHLGWYEEGILRDLNGNAVGARDGVLITPSRVEPIKSLQRIAPIRGVRQMARIKPIFSNYYSNQSLSGFLAGATTPSPSLRPPGTPDAGTYAGTNMKWWVSSVGNAGRTVTLSDGSRWEIYGIDQIHTMLWLPVDNVTVTLARGPIGAYRYTLHHERTGHEVLGEYLGR